MNTTQKTIEQLKAEYRDHRDGCKSCNSDELCDEGYTFLDARNRAIEEAAQ